MSKGLKITQKNSSEVMEVYQWVPRIVQSKWKGIIKVKVKSEVHLISL